MTMLQTTHIEKINPEKHEDKFYQVDMEQSEDTLSFKVTSFWGARGAAKPGSKVWYEGPDRHEATTKYNSLVQAKTKEGYE